MSICGIYSFKNVYNGKRYVGQSLDVFDRKREHLRSLRNGNHYNDHFQRSFIKYGESAFEFSVLEVVDSSLLDVREVAWISHFKTFDRAFGYNKDGGGHVGRIVSEESKRKMSINRIGKGTGRRPPEFGIRQSIARKGFRLGVKASDETRLKMSRARLGKKRGPYKKAVANA